MAVNLVVICLLLGALPSAHALARSHHKLDGQGLMPTVPAKRRNSTHQSRQRLLIAPKYKFLLCHVEDNVDPKLDRLMNVLNGFPEDKHLGSSVIEYFHWSDSQVEVALHDDSWYKAVFLKDPLERLISAFIEKCQTAPDGSLPDQNGDACLFFEQDAQDGAPPPFQEFVARLASKFTREKEPLTYDPQFAPQTSFCGGLNASSYNFVGNFKSNISQQVSHILREVKVDDDVIASTIGILDELGQDQAGNQSITQKYFTEMSAILDARQLYEQDYKAIQHAGSSMHPGQICATALFALDFEKRRILDWISYHNLMGVDCFLLFHDHELGDVSDPEARDVYDKLVRSPLVTLLQARKLSDRIIQPEMMEQWFSAFGSKYLIPIDVDEFIVLDDGLSLDLSDLESTGKAQSPPDLFKFLEENLMLTARGAAGVYLHRWDYGTSGFSFPPSVSEKPEFASLQERWGNSDRAHAEEPLGKMILNLASGAYYTDVHHWQLKSGESATMLFPNGTQMCSATCEPQSAKTRQALSLNHYATGSLSECFRKSSASRLSRYDRPDCDRLHPGTMAYASLASSTGLVEDPVLVKYAEATRKRRHELFPDGAVSVRST